MDIFDLVDPEFNGAMSSDEIWYGGESNICLTDVVEHKADYDHTHTNYAATDHTHEGYAEATHTHTGYATVNHTHTAYAESTHTHSEYAESTHMHTEYAEADHTHSEYASTSHNHNAAYATVNHTHTNKADLVNGKVPISQIPNEVKEVRFANTIAERNAMTGLFVGLTVIVVDATADPTVSSGSAWYVYTGYGWAKTAESESMDVVLEWANIQGKPTAFPPETHTHNEYAVLSDIESLQNSLNNKADVNHTHTGFASQSDLDLLEDVVATKADSTHTHSNYVSQTDFELLEDVVGAKADASHSHSDYALSTHSHNDYATQTSLDVLESELNGKADIGHTHTIANVSGLQNALNAKSDSTHNHDTSYDTKGAANSALNSAKVYADELIEDEVANRDAAIATAKSSAISTAASDATTKITSHNTSTSAHNDIRVLITDLTTKLNNFLDVDDTTIDQLSEVIELIENNKGTLESLTSSKVNVSDIVNNLTTNSTSKVLSAAQGVTIKSLIDDLQTEMDDGFEEITSERIRALFSN